MLKLLKFALVFATFLLIFLGYFQNISAITQDLGRHILNGKIILEGSFIPKINFFSYTYPDFPFINHHWLSEVVFYQIFRIFGFNGLLILTTFVTLLAFFLIYFSVFKAKNIIPISIASILYIGVLLERTDVRPEIFSFLFLSLFIVILYRYRQKFTKWIFLLPFLELLWVNMHIYFIVGIAVIGLFFIDAIIPVMLNLFQHPKRSEIPKQVRNDNVIVLIFILTISALVTLLNPNGLNGAFYPFRIFQNYGYSIEENQNVFFLWQYFPKTTIFFFFISVAFLFVSLIFNFKKVKLIDWLLAIFFSILAASSERNFPLFVFGTFIAFVNALTGIFDRVFYTITSYTSRLKIILMICVLVIISFQIHQRLKTEKIGFGVETGAKNAADFFIQKNIKGPIFNNFDIGSYLEYRLYPKEKVFIDGRPEAYPESFFQKVYIPMQENEALFEKIDNNYQFNAVFFTHIDQTPWAQVFIKQIFQNKNWVLVYLDDYTFILVKNNEQNINIIKSFGIAKESVEINYLSSKNLASLIRFASLFNKINWQEQEEKIYKYMFNIEPNSCFALNNLSFILSRRNDPTASIFINKYRSLCQ